MADKQLNIRIDEDTLAKLKEMCATAGLTQGAALSQMVAMWEDQQLRAAIPERGAEMDSYDAALARLKELYQGSITLWREARTTAQAEATERITAQEATIRQLSERCKGLSAALDEAAKARDEATKAAKATSDMLQMRAELVDSLQAQLDAALDAARAAKAALAVAQAEIADLKTDNAQIEADMEQCREARSAALEAMEDGYRAKLAAKDDMIASLQAQLAAANSLDGLRERLAAIQALIAPPPPPQATTQEPQEPQEPDPTV